MKPSRELPPLEYLQEAFEYVPETGKLFWKKRPLEHFENYSEWSRFNTRWSGREVGTKNIQYTTDKPMNLVFSMLYGGEKRKMLVHRVILAMHSVEMPQGMVVDHIDGNPHNNRLCNLRVIRHAANIANSVYRNGDRTRRDLPRGVYRAKTKAERFISYVSLGGGKKKFLGYFKTSQEASEAFEKDHKERFGS